MSEITRYHDLSEPRKRASANQLGKAFARSSDYTYKHITEILANEADNPPEEIYVNRLVLLGVNILSATLLEHLPKEVLGRDPRPDIALQDFWDDLAALKQAFYDAFDKEVEARINQNSSAETPKEQPAMPNPAPKVHQVAKQHGITSKELIGILQELNYDDITHHMHPITDPAFIDALPHILMERTQPKEPTVATVAKELCVSTAQLIATLAEIDHDDLNTPDAHVYDPEIVDHVREVLGGKALAA